MDSKLQVGVIFLGTSNYTQFLPAWVQSVCANLLVNTDRHLVLLTDDHERSEQTALEFADLPIQSYHVDHEEWPLVTLNRYKNLLSYSEQLLDLDLLVYLDADMSVVKDVDLNDLLGGKRLFSVTHPGLCIGDLGDVEQNPQSCAYISNRDPKVSAYCQGCLWGGYKPFIWDLIATCAEWTQQDWDRKIIAKWHDESYLNRYMYEHRSDKYLAPPSFAYPEKWKLDFEPVIIHRHKLQTIFPRFPGGVVS